MKFKLPPGAPSGLRHTLVALALMAAYASASAANLPSFTFDPTAAGLTGAEFTANNVIVSDYSTITFTDASQTAFSEAGFLNVQNFQTATDSNLVPSGLNSTYGMYIAFSGTGTQSTTAGVSNGTFSTLTYTLYGYSGGAPADFSFSGTTPTTSATGTVALASGSLISGVVSGQAGFGSGASANLSFTPLVSGFFIDPSPFYGVAMTSFTNTQSQIIPFSGGFMISQGGGSVNFTSPVPEPETYALMLAGLGAVGWISRRRRKI